MRPLGMTGHQRLLPGVELAIGGPQQAVGLGLQLRHLFGDIHATGIGEVAQLFDLAFELGNRLFEIKEGGHPVSLAPAKIPAARRRYRSEEHTSELQSLMRISYAVFCLNKKTYTIETTYMH